MLAVNDDHLSLGLVGLHHTMRFTDFLEAKGPRGFDIEPAGCGIRGDLLKRHV